MQSEKLIELDNTKIYTTVVRKINGSNSKNVSISLQKKINTVAEAVTISPSATGNFKTFTESDGLYRGWIYVPAETICNELELEIMVLEGNYNLENAPIYKKYGQSPSIEYKSEVQGVSGDVRLFVKNKDNSENQEVILSLGDKTLYKGDKIIRQNGKWYFSYIWKTINNFSRLSAEGIGLTGKRRGWLPVSGNFKITDKNNNKNGGMSNVTTLAQAGQTYNGQIGFTVGNINTQKRLFIYLEELSNIQTSQEFRDALVELGAYFVLPLEEPELKPIEDVNLINQLNKLLKIKQYEEVTNIDFEQDVVFEIDIYKSEIRVLKESNTAQNIEIEKLKEDINYKDKIISGLQGGQVEEIGEGDNITINNCLELPIKKFDKIYGKEVQIESNYIELEYIESTGSQYIDTGVKVTGKTTIDMDFVNIPTNSSIWKMLLGSREDNLNFTMCINDNNEFGGDYKTQSNLNLTNKTFDWTQKNNIKTKINNNMYELYINDIKEKELAIQEFSYTVNLFLFGFYMNGSVTTRGAKFRFYKCKIYDDDKLIRDFIPVKRKVDNVIGMYDLVERKFYGNNGTGSFITGKELLLLNELNWVEGNQEILHTNENLIDIKPYLYHFVNNNNISIDVIKDDIILNGTPTANYVNLSKAIDITDLLVDGEKYTLYRENDYSAYLQVSAQKYDNTYVYYALNTSNVNYKTFTIDKSTYKRYTIALQLNVINAVENLNDYVVKSMLIRGNEIPQKYINNKLETYQLSNLPAFYSENDCIYYNKILNEYFIHDEWNKYIFTGNENWNRNVNQNNVFYAKCLENCYELATVKSDAFLGSPKTFGIIDNNCITSNFSNGAKNEGWIMCKCDELDLEEFKQEIAGKYVIYKFKKPTDTKITDPVLIEQLDKLRAIFTYKGTNNFIVTAENGQSANLKIIAYKDSIKILNDKINDLEKAILNS